MISFSIYHNFTIFCYSDKCTRVNFRNDNTFMMHKTNYLYIFFTEFSINRLFSFPDVMMPSYSRNKWYAIYFVSYICTMLYVMMNLMLAVVNETFTAAERDKFKKLLLHKRRACQHSFKLLVSKQNPDKMQFRQFRGLMRYYAPHKCKCLHHSVMTNNYIKLSISFFAYFAKVKNCLIF